MKAQPRVKGFTRIPSYTALLPVLRRAVDAEARRYKVSRSFVIAVALAHGLNLESEIESYTEPQRRARRRAA